MRRGTPSAELFGGLLAIIRITGTGRSMRQVGDRIGAPASTVSQVEKGQRALKEPKIAAWAVALEVNKADLHELWFLSQGLIPVDGGRVLFYSDRPQTLGTEPLRDGLVPPMSNGQDLEPIYRLALRIAAVLRRLLPDASLWVSAENFEPTYILEAAMQTVTPEQEDEDADAAQAPELPLIEFEWHPTSEPRDRADARLGAIRVPLLQKVEPIVRRRRGSVRAVELEDLISDLSAPERERVRGYIEAIVEQRADLGG